MYRSGEVPPPGDRQIMQQVRQAGAFGGGMGGGGGGGGGGRGSGRRLGGSEFQFGGEDIVFALKNGAPTPTYVPTRLNDLDYSEVVDRVSDKESGLVLASGRPVAVPQEVKKRL